MQVNRSFSGHVYLQAPNLIPSAPFVANAAQTKFEEAYIHMPPCCKLRCSSCPFGLFFHMIPLRHRPGPVVCSFLALSGLCLCLSPAFLLFTELAGLDNIVRLVHAGTGNQVRILPNFIHHMWFAALNGSGLAATTYGPNVVVATVGAEGARAAVQIEVTTDYPFGTQLRFNVTSRAETTTSSSGARERSEEKVAPVFPLLLRIPEWTTIDAMQVTIGGATRKLVPDEVCSPHSHTHERHHEHTQPPSMCCFLLSRFVGI